MGFTVGSYLAIKEVWRNKGRFLMVSAVIALITLLVLFLAALGEGLAAGNKEYLGKLNGDLILYQDQANLSVSASQIGRSLVNDVLRVPGVESAGAIGFGSVFISYDGSEDPLSVSMLGVEPGLPGEPPAFSGRTLSSIQASEAVIGRNIALRTDLDVGDTVTVKSTQGGIDEFYDLKIVGVSDGRQYFLQPALFVPLRTWDRIRPKPVADNGRGELVFNLIAVKLSDPTTETAMITQLETRLSGIEAVNRQTAYEAAPGYSAQQSTLQTQQGFTLLVGLLVVGGFFQIQTLQKVAQVGMLKALGASNLVVGLAAIIQIVFTNLIGVVIGAAGTISLAANFPVTVPVVFDGSQVLVAVVTLLLIGPLGGLVSLRLLFNVEPLTALGLAS